MTVNPHIANLTRQADKHRAACACPDRYGVSSRSRQRLAQQAVQYDDSTGAPYMPWNSGGPGPWGTPPGSSGGDGDKKPAQGPWGNAGGNKGGNDGGERPESGPRRPGGPFGGGGGPFGGGGGPFG